MNEIYQSSITVKTKKELLQAKKEGYGEIIVIGALANKLKIANKITKLSPAKLGILTASLGAATVAAPATGGISYFAAAPIAAMTGVNIAAIIAVTAIGSGLLIALYKDYEEITVKRTESEEGTESQGGKKKKKEFMISFKKKQAQSSES